MSVKISFLYIFYCFLEKNIVEIDKPQIETYENECLFVLPFYGTGSKLPLRFISFDYSSNDREREHDLKIKLELDLQRTKDSTAMMETNLIGISSNL